MTRQRSFVIFLPFAFALSRNNPKYEKEVGKKARHEE